MSFVVVVVSLRLMRHQTSFPLPVAPLGPRNGLNCATTRTI